jgi:hypothetical protein
LDLPPLSIILKLQLSTLVHLRSCRLWSTCAAVDSGPPAQKKKRGRKNKFKGQKLQKLLDAIPDLQRARELQASGVDRKAVRNFNDHFLAEWVEEFGLEADPHLDPDGGKIGEAQEEEGSDDEGDDDGTSQRRKTKHSAESEEDKDKDEYNGVSQRRKIKRRAEGEEDEEDEDSDNDDRASQRRKTKHHAESEEEEEEEVDDEDDDNSASQRCKIRRSANLKEDDDEDDDASEQRKIKRRADPNEDDDEEEEGGDVVRSGKDKCVAIPNRAKMIASLRMVS